MTTKTAATYVLTPEVRLSFPALFEPRPAALDKPDELTYQATLLLPPSFDLKPLHEAMKAAMIAKWGKVIQIPASKNPIRDCLEKPEYAGYEEGWHFLRTKSKRKPAVVNRQNIPVTDPDSVYPGMWVLAYINAWAWDHKVGGKGVSFGLNAVQVVRDDTRIDGVVNTAGIFQALDPIEGGSSADSADASDFFS